MTEMDILTAHGLIGAAKPPPSPTVQTFTASGTWTKPVGAVRVFIECVGGGGGGNRGSNTNDKYGGGGGGAEHRLILASQLPATVAVTVGAGGIGSSYGTSTKGGNSSFGSYVGGREDLGGYAATNNAAGTSGRGGGLPPSNAHQAEYSPRTYAGGDGVAHNIDNAGGSSRYGGGGGGGGNNGANYAGGSSETAGNGGYPNGAGGIPGGGGAGANGNGARGQVRVTTYYA